VKAVPLSDHEQRLLEQMERALYAEDPKLASTLTRGHHSVGVSSRRGVALGFLLMVGGLAAVVGGVAIDQLVLGLVGFVLVVTGLVMLARGLRAPSGDLSAVPNPAQDAAPGSSKFMGRMEDRWNRRQEGDQPTDS
jgi:hypothetical protein